MICEPYIPAILTCSVLAAFNPRPDVRTWDWICENGRTHKAEPFDGDRIPWCEGVCDAWDDPTTREIYLMWGTRLGKTTISHQILASTAVLKPMPGLFGTSTQTLAKRTVRRKIYPILDAIAATRGQLPPPRLRALEEIRLGSSPWGVAWSGSDTQLADLEAYYGIANEIDKWSMNERQEGEAGEGDSLDQYDERFKENPDHKKLYECSPSTATHSRINKKMLASNNCRFWVPCPRCRERQKLILGSDNPHAGGILFDRLPDGTIDPSLARSTARYVCCHCQYEIHNDQRPRMMRAGKWAPEGCKVDINGRIVGTPKRDSTYVGFQLSSLYSLQMNWGDIAARFAKTIGNPTSLRMFVNGWIGEVWEVRKNKSEPEQVAERLSVDTPRGVMPIWSTWLFGGVDRQDDHFVWLALAVGPDEQEHVVDYGTAETWEEVERQLINRKFRHEDGGEDLSPALTLRDSGYNTKEAYAECKRSKGKVWPCKGSNNDCGGKAFEAVQIGIAHKGKKERTQKRLAMIGRGLFRIRVSAYYYEPITQDQLDLREPGEPGGLSLHAGCRNDIDFVKQLCNGYESNEPSKINPDRCLWLKLKDSEPNDYRDTKKYARAAVDVKLWASEGRGFLQRRQGTPPAPVGQVQESGTSKRLTRHDRPKFRPDFSGRRGR